MRADRISVDVWHTFLVNRNDTATGEQSGGLLLLLTTLVALLWANSPWHATYAPLWHASVTLGRGSTSVSVSLLGVINNGLMAVFFLLLGVGIRRDATDGPLVSPRQAVLPVAAAVGGIVTPALFYLALNAGRPGAAGWGIPMATDPAFALGLLALLGRRVPPALCGILAALAVVDDIAAVVVIAAVYHAGIDGISLLLSAAVVAVLVAVARAGVRHPSVYATLGGILWLATLRAGVSPTIAGVLLALALPAPAVPWLERVLSRPVSVLIVPLFALANAGITVGHGWPAALAAPVTLGVAVGLVLGKQVGITLGAWLAVRSGIALLPPGLRWRHIYGIGWLGGLGFTTALFIANLAFGDTAPLVAAKLGVLVAGIVAGIGGCVLLFFGGPERARA